jgi:hypothetical protein
MLFSKPNPDEYLPYYDTYINRVPESHVENILDFMARTHLVLLNTLSMLSETQANHRPGPNEWNIKEIIGHVCDGERVFAYRALRFARQDTTPLASFDQDAYVPAGEFTARPLMDVWNEFDAQRQATVALFRTFTPAMLLRRGEASNAMVSVRALAYIIAGHEDHHLESIRTVYLR